MAAFREVWRKSFSAGAINASESEAFGADLDTQQSRDRYGSANFLVITSLASEHFRIDLDGITDRTIGILAPGGSFVINPEDGIYFDHVSLVNVSASNSGADEVKIKMARSELVQA